MAAKMILNNGNVKSLSNMFYFTLNCAPKWNLRLPFFFRSTVIASPSSRRQMILGAGKPSALHVIFMFWFSRTATDEGVLSISRIFGGTKHEDC